jgi:hypothetical protein
MTEKQKMTVAEAGRLGGLATAKNHPKTSKDMQKLVKKRWNKQKKKVGAN